MIETTDRPVPVKLTSEREFGVVFAIVFVVIACWPLLSGGAVRLWSMGVAASFFALALLIPKVLAPASNLWTKFGALLHAVASPIALGILFYIVVTPTGQLMRLFGKDPLRLDFDPAAESYWIKRDPPGPGSDTLNDQF